VFELETVNYLHTYPRKSHLGWRRSKRNLFVFWSPIIPELTAPLCEAVSWTEVASCLMPGAGLHYRYVGTPFNVYVQYETVQK
jgi:hypothetical protein